MKNKNQITRGYQVKNNSMLTAQSVNQKCEIITNSSAF